ncbi:hypothetical protein CROQUDRAFT_663169 [Cronartium quercuum f. sp. fusiforme G11]|uniref:Chalcone isomerase domain-containing protein n=1 Tax=Cronartium quercuum f. sp. fusiforme G11 TaxID=708437 RepID=A0A9P6NDY7_9BASI|nr:hypothetical protein CROQUDRAFT_663169 [Cronartium quercuum f. sp. fusiforme G11]
MLLRSIRARSLFPPPSLSLHRPFTLTHPQRHLSNKTAKSPNSPPHSDRAQIGIRQFLTDLNLSYSLPIGFALGVGLYAYIQSQLPEDSDGQARTLLSSKEPLPPLIELPKPDHTFVLDPSTQISFPTEICLSESCSNDDEKKRLRLIGVGVRTISFLGIKVYSIGFYVDESLLRALRVIPGWNTDITKEKLLFTNFNDVKPSSVSRPSEQELTTTTTGTTTSVVKPISGENLMRNLISAPVNFAIRIAPAKSTDFTHLRDGFCRSITARVSRAVKQGLLTDFEAERASESIKTFRNFFPAGVSVPKGKSILLRKTSNDSLVIEYDGRTLGELKDRIITQEIFLAYFADIDPISVKFKEAVAEGFEKFYNN